MHIRLSRAVRLRRGDGGPVGVSASDVLVDVSAVTFRKHGPD